MSGPVITMGKIHLLVLTVCPLLLLLCPPPGERPYSGTEPASLVSPALASTFAKLMETLVKLGEYNFIS